MMDWAVDDRTSVLTCPTRARRLLADRAPCQIASWQLIYTDILHNNWWPQSL